MHEVVTVEEQCDKQHDGYASRDDQAPLLRPCPMETFAAHTRFRQSLDHVATSDSRRPTSRLRGANVVSVPLQPFVSQHGSVRWVALHFCSSPFTAFVCFAAHPLQPRLAQGGKKALGDCWISVERPLS